MALAEAILGAVSSIGNVVATGLNKAAQGYALRKGIENETIQFEQNKTLSAYSGISSTRWMIVIVIAVLLFVMIIPKIRK